MGNGPKQKTRTFKLDARHDRRLELKAGREDRTVSQVLRELVRRYIENGAGQ